MSRGKNKEIIFLVVSLWGNVLWFLEIGKSRREKKTNQKAGNRKKKEERELSVYCKGGVGFITRPGHHSCSRKQTATLAKPVSHRRVWLGIVDIISSLFFSFLSVSVLSFSLFLHFFLQRIYVKMNTMEILPFTKRNCRSSQPKLLVLEEIPQKKL